MDANEPRRHEERRYSRTTKAITHRALVSFYEFNARRDPVILTRFQEYKSSGKRGFFQRAPSPRGLTRSRAHPYYPLTLFFRGKKDSEASMQRALTG